MAAQGKQGLSPEERHQVIMDYLKEKKKSTKVFHLRWSEPDLITAKVVTSTPAFWYKRYGWKRRLVEKMFFQAQIVVDQLLD